MAFSEFEQALNQKALTWFMDKRRPPKHIRPQLDIGYTVVGHTVDLFEIRVMPALQTIDRDEHCCFFG